MPTMTATRVPKAAAATVPSAIVMISADRMKSVRTAPLIFCFSSATRSMFGSASARASSLLCCESSALCDCDSLCASFSKPS